MNDLKDLVIALDGYSVDKTGFEITSAYKESGESGDFWSLSVKAYKKECENYTSESNVSMLTLVDRIENRYGTHSYDTHSYGWAVVKVQELTTGSFELTVKKVTDEKKDSSDEEEHVEAEE